MEMREWYGIGRLKRCLICRHTAGHRWSVRTGAVTDKWIRGQQTVIVDGASSATDSACFVARLDTPGKSASGGGAFFEARSLLCASVFFARFSSRDLEGRPRILRPIPYIMVGKLIT